ncbi:hypothetical protein [Actinoplanes regularis]|uniref:hypothetical protein n=1 Tax=Actinoplanes regularis TaxID=52697 RepID=UPI0024A32F92|nr:hypothetical protein [Actinoplanes regularis]GLW29307.1 hypothetical protein Areg01_22470 [Actinoplanes regularis]
MTTRVSDWKAIAFMTAVVVAATTLTGVEAAHAICLALPRDSGFEQQRSGSVRSPWIGEGRVGIDRGKGYSLSGSNNAWARNVSGWNAIRQSVYLYKGELHTLTVAIRSSGNVRDGYTGFRNEAQRPVAEVKFGPLTRYRTLRVQFRPAVTGRYNLFAGFWALGQDAWIQIDEVHLERPCWD